MSLGMNGPDGAYGCVGVSAAAVVVSGLTVATARQRGTVLQDLDLRVGAAEFVGLAGESGSGKTTLGLALLGYSPPGLRSAAGTAQVHGTVLTGAARGLLRGLRGATISYVPQDPGTALNPGLRIRSGFREVLRAHGVRSRRDQDERMSDLLTAVGLPAGQEFRARYPHQLSGGQKQRVAIAMAFSCRPSVVVMDEPTTGLDAAVKTRVIELIRQLGQSQRTSVILISHDIRMLVAATDRLVVMYAGRIVEDGPAAAVAASPRHPYTRRLFAALPDPASGRLPQALPGTAPGPAERGVGCDFASRCDFAAEQCRTALPQPREAEPRHTARCLRMDELGSAPAEIAEPVARRSAPSEPFLRVAALTARHGKTAVTRAVDLVVGHAECAALVGESGSGKTTIARAIAGLHSDYSGTVSVGGCRLEQTVTRRPAADRRLIQYVFQNPYASLNPRRAVASSVALAARTVLGLNLVDAEAAAAAMIELVGLRADQLTALPRDLSGGERQRVALARALVCQPAVLICDEVTSSLDVSVQAGVVALLRRLQDERDLTMLFITHDLALAASISDTTIVLRAGEVVEYGLTGQVLGNPQDPYTQALVAASA
jgi:peptide/nickel transport system ATP-binding protein